MQLHTAGLISIKDKKLLLAFSNYKQCFYLPGGKIDDKETAKQALCREIEEELNVQVTETGLQYYSSAENGRCKDLAEDLCVNSSFSFLCDEI